MKTRALILTSTAPRHQYFQEIMAGSFTICGVLVQDKKNYYDEQKSRSTIIREHFDRLKNEEVTLFGECKEDVSVLGGKKVSDINDKEHIAWALAQRVEVVLLFGTAILGDEWLAAFPNKIINLHLGLSPFYRGSATLFWPFYYKEIECVGTTIHIAAKKVDAGNILLRIKPSLSPGDDYYAITNKLIKKSIDATPDVVHDYLVGRLESIPQESVNGRLCRKSDFSEEAVCEVNKYVGSGLLNEEITRIRMSAKCRCLQ